MSALHIHHLQGAAGRVDPRATAFGNRDARIVLNIVGTWADPADSVANTRWVRDTHAAISEHSNGSGYVNFMADEDQSHVRAAYSRTAYERLVALKRAYDPRNLFQLNQNIRPD
jgi:hypothetical protein